MKQDSMDGIYEDDNKWNFNGIPKTDPVNSITFIQSKNGFWKYNEDKTLKDLESYLQSTYHSHYTSEQSKTQTLDLIESIGDAEPFSRSNAIKYLSRFGRKNGKSKLDLLKAMHYCVLLYHFSGLHNNNTDEYKTF
jgi:hypothetical protein